MSIQEREQERQLADTFDARRDLAVIDPDQPSRKERTKHFLESAGIGYMLHTIFRDLFR